MIGYQSYLLHTLPSCLWSLRIFPSLPGLRDLDEFWSHPYAMYSKALNGQNVLALDKTGHGSYLVLYLLIVLFALWVEVFAFLVHKLESLMLLIVETAG